jgi:hypothetical protein
MGGGGSKPGSKADSGGLFSKPKLHKNNRRLIKGQPYTFNPKLKRWGPNKSGTPAPAPAFPAANAVTIVTLPLPASPAPATPVQGAKNQMIQLAVANSARAVNSAFESLALQFMDE